MKKLLVMVLLLSTSVVLFATETKQSRKERKAEQRAQQVELTKQLIESKSWQFEATQMLPSSGSSRSLTSNYSVQFTENTVDSYLPYMGRAYSVDYGSTDSPMSFQSEIEDYELKEGKKGSTTIKFTARNKSDRVVFTFKISENGSTSLSVNSTNRAHISYYGNLTTLEEQTALNN